MPEHYDLAGIERRWRSRWEAEPPRRIDVRSADPDRKFYMLVEFPYPSAEGLHVGHVYTYCGADAYSRVRRMRGRDVFQPIGFDSFGINAENYALKVGENPRSLIARTVDNYRRQLRHIGAAWDWDHEVVTSDPAYYRWTQWVFLQLYRAGLAVRREAPSTWCPSCLTVLANEQLEAGRCERCGSEVTVRVMNQWFLRTTAYADRLVDGLERLEWPELAKRLQAEWIGRSRGVEIRFPLADAEGELEAFTTRPDTLLGVTYLAVAPDLATLEGLPLTEARRHDAVDFVARLGAGEAHERGLPLGLQARNPATGEPVPLYAADYVLAEYGTGVVMGVPAHDERDLEFARALRLPVKPVDLAPEMAAWLERQGLGRAVTRYRMHDWLISRQRYWGPPIPIVYCEACGTVPVPEEDLPVLLPDVEQFRPTGTALSPLAAIDEFVHVDCPRCGGRGRRETDVSDTFLDSAWYFLRYPSTDVDDRPWDPGRTRRMLPVDLYAGGREHVRRHHLYARFTTMALHDLGHLPFDEPFPRLLLHGLLLKEGAKMSKSRGNVVNPDDYIARYGADNLRMYLLFCGDWQEGGDFSDAGLVGIIRFTERVWRTLTALREPGDGSADLRFVDRAVARVSGDVERLKFNTAIAALMELRRRLDEERPAMSAEQWERAARTFTLLLAPFVPHLAEELWARLGGPYSVHAQPWPEYDATALEQDQVTLVLQVDGKVRDRVSVPSDISDADARAVALANERVRAHLNDHEPSRVVVVPGKLVNVVS